MEAIEVAEVLAVEAYSKAHLALKTPLVEAAKALERKPEELSLLKPKSLVKETLPKDELQKSPNTNKNY